MKRIVPASALTFVACLLLTSNPRAAGSPCPADAVLSGTTCIDRYEASVWETTNKSLIAKIRAGSAALVDLVSGGAIQRGVIADDYGSDCPDSGNGCTNLYALSGPGVGPSRFITWFQAQAVARNSGKRLATNAEWQATALGTPDPGTDNGTTDCNVAYPLAVVFTASRAACLSDAGA